ncbi:chromosome segregation DNA-binding protein [Rhodoblastus acidophilus]|uniref:Chromosome segregation DNA-binding protein n=1 Tax=Rhodoblastus acidophilus TaxID=1074 RepID=A0A212S4R3_RHOAC|nr:ParB/RepB/Spo0J family partition protein [Rhodoblastus acidophilus]PPQ37738.1 chromosome partitioning protein ParB [Rhodoblastus acidophilus]RAI23950.1 chromosome partitioning protein ParB [Rhodoblastus acidophilus]SNB80164.1 chromosome segregation DNA-binding protein [Rhodoblastus acidophilus]
MIDDARPRLGRGLAALIGENLPVESAAGPVGQRTAPIEFLRANPRNPRQHFSDESLQELSESIRERGIIQPIVVRELEAAKNIFEIIAGERRWRAAQRIGLHEVPIVVVEADDRLSLELAIIENVQRTDLNAIEEAEGYDRLIAEFAYTQADLAKILGKSRSYVTNTLRLLKLPDSVRSYVVDGRISAGHARALLSLDDPTAMVERIVNEGLSVRDVERLVAEGDEKKPPRPSVPKAPDIVRIEKNISDALGVAINVNARGESGSINIKFKSIEQFDLITKKLLD